MYIETTSIGIVYINIEELSLSGVLIYYTYNSSNQSILIFKLTITTFSMKIENL